VLQRKRPQEPDLLYRTIYEGSELRYLDVDRSPFDVDGYVYRVKAVMPLGETVWSEPVTA